MIFFIQLFISSNLYSQNNEDTWNGWLGLEKKGIKKESSAPVVWNEKENILWKTEIPGKGHSSPIVSAKNVFVTTAYTVEKNKLLSDIFQYLIYAASAFLFFVFVFQIRKFFADMKNFTVKNILQIWGFSFILGLVLYYAQTGIFFTGNDGSDHIIRSIRWYYSAMFVFLCIMLITYTLKIRLRNQILFLAGSLLFLCFMIWFRPAPEYYKISDSGYISDTILKAVKFAVWVILILIISLFFIKKKNVTTDNIKSIKKTRFILFIFISGITGFFILGMFGIGIYRILIVRDIPALSFDPFLEIFFRDNNVFKGMIFLGLVVWIISYISNFRNQFLIQSKKIFIGLIVLSTLVFIRNNFLLAGDETVYSVVCIDRASGKIRWSKDVFSGSLQNLHPDNTPASPTSLIADNLVYAYFGSPGLICMDEDGNKIWENTQLPFEDIHGIGTSPVYSDDKIIILNDQPKAPYLIALNSKSGKTEWLTKRKSWNNFHGAHRTPEIINYKGQKIIVTWGMYGLNGYDFLTGKELFDYPLKNSIGQLVASFQFSGDTLFAPDLKRFHAFHLGKLLEKIKSEIWSVKMQSKGPVCSSPVLYNNMLFMVSDNGYASCLDAKNGKLIWRTKLNGTYLSSCILINDNVFFSSTSGLTTVIAADKTFRKIAENKLPEPIFASLAPVNNQLFIRTTSHVWCVAKK
ncbi:MAG: hypothetical protein A2275_10890 [Bacteroidetes bacterium RIFOXYA12_FULL_35_11]|nr:MAG: hypothetical protein A2X01_08520 [Bacteroidetes bacterium GWF2_35_48]OFY74580.1 MAG: hypothetical protein A2275_10890 [Bacteroidetes bacterium RIFOXYA12_FULL_35_11]OFY95991.1 MAG: hypothetical protein A2491_07375 [Bacteroidetes bacterium RIFOXYC12_FULL_35_7]